MGYKASVLEVLCIANVLEILSIADCFCIAEQSNYEVQHGWV